jgi:hypothetical protein
MNHYQRKSHGQIEITDLVAEAVSNAAAGRNQVLNSEEPLSPLSDEQTESIKGGSFTLPIPIDIVVTIGIIAPPPVCGVMWG